MIALIWQKRHSHGQQQFILSLRDLWNINLLLITTIFLINTRNFVAILTFHLLKHLVILVVFIVKAQSNLNLIQLNMENHHVLFHIIITLTTIPFISFLIETYQLQIFQYLNKSQIIRQNIVRISTTS